MVHFCGMLEIVVDLKLKLTSVQTAHVKVSWKTYFKVEKLYPPCLDLISSPSLSMKIQIMGRKITEKSGVQIQAPEGQNCFVIFSFHFQIFTQKWVSLILTTF